MKTCLWCCQTWPPSREREPPLWKVLQNGWTVPVPGEPMLHLLQTGRDHFVRAFFLCSFHECWQLTTLRWDATPEWCLVSPRIVVGFFSYILCKTPLFLQHDMHWYFFINKPEQSSLFLSRGKEKGKREWFLSALHFLTVFLTSFITRIFIIFHQQSSYKAYNDHWMISFC